MMMITTYCNNAHGMLTMVIIIMKTESTQIDLIVRSLSSVYYIKVNNNSNVNSTCCSNNSNNIINQLITTPNTIICMEKMCINKFNNNKRLCWPLMNTKRRSRHTVVDISHVSLSLLCFSYFSQLLRQLACLLPFRYASTNEPLRVSPMHNWKRWYWPPLELLFDIA